MKFEIQNSKFERRTSYAGTAQMSGPLERTPAVVSEC